MLRGMQQNNETVMRLHPERRSFGSRNALSVLDEEQAAGILGLKSSGAAPTELADRFGVSASTIRRIWSRKTWPHLDDTHAARI